MLQNFYEKILPIILPYNTELILTTLFLFVLILPMSKFRLHRICKIKLENAHNLKKDEIALSKNFIKTVYILGAVEIAIFFDIVITYGTWRTSDVSSLLIYSLVAIPFLLIVIVSFIIRWVYSYSQSNITLK